MSGCGRWRGKSPWNHPLATAKRLTLLAFALWEAWWAYVFLSTPVPDEAMHRVAAVLFGLFLPAGLLAIYLLVSGVRVIMRSKD